MKVCLFLLWLMAFDVSGSDVREHTVCVMVLEGGAVKIGKVVNGVCRVTL
ncbi:hypothetical protein [Veronia pacifica]|nr:hypothetical protein [Veronia pacifica]